jgi:hypothetical protein
MGLASKLAAFAARLTSDSKVPQTALAANVAGNGPLLFSGAVTSGVSVPPNTSVYFTSFQASLYDTTSAFSTSTGRFTPQVAGYYLVMGFVGYDSNGITGSAISATIAKNGTNVAYSALGTSATYPKLEISTLVYFNGTTDYVMVGTYQNGAATANGVYAQIQACLVRAA